MVENKIQEEILYREGLQMGLDKDDTIVKRRMAQKVQFLAEDVAAAHEPSTKELKAWFAGNAEKFALPGRVTFRHVFFGFDKRGQNAQKDAAAALPRLAGQPQNSPLAAATADAFMFEDYYADRTAQQLAKEFGPTFAVGIFGLKPGAWTGPLESGYGWHLVFIDSIIPGASRSSRRSSRTCTPRGWPRKSSRPGRRPTRACARGTRCCCPQPQPPRALPRASRRAKSCCRRRPRPSDAAAPAFRARVCAVAAARGAVLQCRSGARGATLLPRDHRRRTGAVRTPVAHPGARRHAPADRTAAAAPGSKTSGTPRCRS